MTTAAEPGPRGLDRALVGPRQSPPPGTCNGAKLLLSSTSGRSAGRCRRTPHSCTQALANNSTAALSPYRSAAAPRHAPAHPGGLPAAAWRTPQSRAQSACRPAPRWTAWWKSRGQTPRQSRAGDGRTAAPLREHVGVARTVGFAGLFRIRAGTRPHIAAAPWLLSTSCSTHPKRSEFT